MEPPRSHAPVDTTELWNRIEEAESFAEKLSALKNLPPDPAYARELAVLLDANAPADWSKGQHAEWFNLLFAKWAFAERDPDIILSKAETIVGDGLINIAQRDEALRTTINRISSLVAPAQAEYNAEFPISFVSWLLAFTDAKETNSLPGTALLGLGYVESKHPQSIEHGLFESAIADGLQSSNLNTRLCALQVVADHKMTPFIEPVTDILKNAEIATELAKAWQAFGQIGSLDELIRLSEYTPVPTPEVFWARERARLAIETRQEAAKQSDESRAPAHSQKMNYGHGGK